MAGVGGDDGEAILKSGAHVEVIDAAGKAPIAHS